MNPVNFGYLSTDDRLKGNNTMAVIFLNILHTNMMIDTNKTKEKTQYPQQY